MAKTYRVNHLRYYAKGVLYQEGDLITVDDNVKPSRAWEPVDKAVEAPPKQDPKPAATKRGGRASDSEPNAA